LLLSVVVATRECGMGNAFRGKGKSKHLYSALYGIQTSLKRSGMDHTVLPAINTIPAVCLVSVHQMAHPPIEVAYI